MPMFLVRTDGSTLFFSSFFFCFFSIVFIKILHHLPLRWFFFFQLQLLWLVMCFLHKFDFLFVFLYSWFCIEFLSYCLISWTVTRPWNWICVGLSISISMCFGLVWCVNRWLLANCYAYLLIVMHLTPIPLSLYHVPSILCVWTKIIISLEILIVESSFRNVFF